MRVTDTKGAITHFSLVYWMTFYWDCCTHESPRRIRCDSFPELEYGTKRCLLGGDRKALMDDYSDSLRERIKTMESEMSTHAVVPCSYPLLAVLVA